MGWRLGAAAAHATRPAPRRPNATHLDSSLELQTQRLQAPAPLAREGGALRWASALTMAQGLLIVAPQMAPRTSVKRAGRGRWRQLVFYDSRRARVRAHTRIGGRRAGVPNCAGSGHEMGAASAHCHSRSYGPAPHAGPGGCRLQIGGPACRPASSWNGAIKLAPGLDSAALVAERSQMGAACLARRHSNTNRGPEAPKGQLGCVREHQRGHRLLDRQRRDSRLLRAARAQAKRLQGHRRPRVLFS